ncbi:MAG: stage V sporulation protein E [Candidatus Eisenbacteria bacterium]|nr:stage V sporulation protein E [Candidatus Eisenbacteria bacterium]
MRELRHVPRLRGPRRQVQGGGARAGERAGRSRGKRSRRGGSVRGAVQSDRGLIWATLILGLVGIVAVYTASVHIAEHSFGGSHVFLKRNAVRAVVGLAALLFAYRIDYRSYRRHATKAVVMAIVLLGLTLGLGTAIRGMRARLFMFQPGELAKLALVFYMADVMVRRKGELEGFKYGVLPRLILAGIVIGLILLQPDFGNALAVAVLTLILLFLGGARLTHVGGLAALAGIGGYFAIKTVPHIIERWQVWRASYDLSLSGLDTEGAGYQIYQSLVALGSGGLIGRGVGESMQRAFIPDPYTDFAFSIWGEELGLLGTIGVVALFALVLWRGLRIAKRAPDEYGTVLAAGLTAMITVYAVINIGVATALFPTTGLPLPFISYGGSSLVVNMAAIGVLLNMSKRVVPEPGSVSSLRIPVRKRGAHARKRKKE